MAPTRSLPAYRPDGNGLEHRLRAGSWTARDLCRPQHEVDADRSDGRSGGQPEQRTQAAGL